MAKVTIRKKFSGGDPKIWMQDTIKKIEDANHKSMLDALEEGENLMREAIETRGTELSGKRGRIEKGIMLNAVKSAPQEQSKTKFRGKFGWIDLQEDYFYYQDQGFRHVGSGRMVEGMYALQDSASEVWLNLREDIERNIRDA